MQTFRIKQKMWSMGGKFTISDDLGLPRYQVEGSLFQIPKTFTVSDTQGNIISQIEKEFMTLLPRFKIQLADGSYFCLNKEFTVFAPRYRIENLNMTIQGDFWNMDFELSRDGQHIARISQEWLRLTSTYNIEVYEDKYADLVTSLVIAIDYVKEMEANASNSN